MSSARPENFPARETPVHEGTVLPPGGDAERLRAEIERTRQHLGVTVEQLAARLDVKTRAQARAAELAGQVKTRALQARKVAQEHGPAQKLWVPLSAAGVVLVVFALIIWQRRKR
jgi:hypothetical protein